MFKNEYNHAINACILGYLLVLIALFLNYTSGNKVGLCLGIVTVALTYLSESYRTVNVVPPRGIQGFSLVSCIASYIVWLV